MSRNPALPASRIKLTAHFCHLLSYSVFRAFQGALSSGIGTLAYIILSDLVPLTERGKYQAIIDIIVSPHVSDARALYVR